jgi:RNA-directed DNA polymerase
MHDDNCKPCIGPTRSETLSMPGNFLHRSWEISSVPVGDSTGGTDKANGRKPVVYADEKSDTPVVPEKLPNKGIGPAEVVEERGVAKGNADESPTSRAQDRINVSTGLEGVRQKARLDKRARFTSLLHHVTPSLLVESFYALKKNAASGVDDVTWREYEGQLYGRVHGLHLEIHTGAYKALPSRRAYISKADGSKRPLGIAAIEDKIVQQAISTVLSAVYEEDFLGFSYGFRPGRSQHQALDALWMGIVGRKVGWILDADISDFFGSIDHEWMERFLAHRIADKRVLRLIRKWLKAGTIEDGKRVLAEKGAPQGAVISPLLSNIYLHYVFDLWAHHWRRHHGAGEVILVRYADDSVMGFEYEREATRFLAAMRERFARFGLKLHPEKTRLIEFGKWAAVRRQRRGLGRPESFNFLGFTHCCGTTRQGRFKIVRLTIRKRMAAKLKEIRDCIKKRMHEPVKAIGKWLGAVLRGYFNYHAVPDNLNRLDSFRNVVGRIWLKALRRRSQRHKMTWKRFARFVHMYLPKARQQHPYPPKRFGVTT